MKHRFQVTSVDELGRDKKAFRPSEIIPLINITNEIPSTNPSAASFTTINETTQPSAPPYNRFLEDFKKNSLLTPINQNLNRSSSSNVHPNNILNGNLNSKVEETDSNYSTVQSTVYDTNAFRFTNKFLYELRLKRRELREKSHDIPIEHRIALNRRQYFGTRLRAQDIFDVHFELDEDHHDGELLDESLQEKIRKNIFNELDRQRTKTYSKQHRQLVYGRALLIFFTSLLLFMSITLIYFVIDLYDRAQYLDIILPDNKFLSIIYDETEIN